MNLKSIFFNLLVHQSPTVVLNTWTSQHHVPTRYVLLNEQYLPPSIKSPQILFTYRLYFGHNLYFDGHGPSHQQARNNCAYHALNFIYQNHISNMIPTPITDVNLFHIEKQKLYKILLDSTKISNITYV